MLQVERASALRVVVGLAGAALILASPLSGEGARVAFLRHALFAGGLVLLVGAIPASRRARAIALSTLGLAYASVAVWGPGPPHFGLWLVRQAAFGPDAIGILRADETLGFAHVPGARGEHRGFDFVARYGIDERGCRRTPAKEAPRGTVLLLGGSYAFGHGVDDEETFAWILGEEHWPDLDVRNCAGMGFGTMQAYLLLRDALRESRPSLVVYTWHDHHLYRNDLRQKWLRALARYGRQQPLFEVEDGRPVYAGVVGAERGMPDSPELRARELAVTEALLAAMRDECAAAGVPLFVVRFSTEGGGTDPRILALFERLSLRHVDATGVAGSFYPNDRHPRADWHRATAAAIAHSEIGAALR